MVKNVSTAKLKLFFYLGSFKVTKTIWEVSDKTQKIEYVANDTFQRKFMRCKNVRIVFLIYDGHQDHITRRITGIRTLKYFFDFKMTFHLSSFEEQVFQYDVKFNEIVNEIVENTGLEKMKPNWY